LRIRIGAMGNSGWIAVEQDAESDGLAARWQPHHKVQIPHLKALDDAPPRSCERG
jgi:hypothetical protein